MDMTYDQWADAGFPDDGAADGGSVPLANYIVPGQKSRARELSKRLVSFDQIGAVLTSNYMVKGWLDRNCLSMLYGPSNAGKTFVALDIAMHIAADMPWRGLRVNGGPVLYIAAEGGAGIRNRLAAIRHEHPDMASAPFTLLPVGLDLHAQGDALAVCEIMPDVAPALVVIDTLARSMGAGDENTAKDAAMFVRNCDLIREATGAHVMVIHHTGKDEDRGARGSSALRAAVDNEIQITSEWEILSRKQRDQEPPAPLHFKLRSVVLGMDEDGEPVTSAVVDVAAPPIPTCKPLKGKNEVAMQALYDALRDHGTTKSGNTWPANCKVVEVDHWREACGTHGLTTGVSDSAARTAFMRAKTKLMDMDDVREFGGFVWRVQGDE
ncbi:AAA family ATPase [Sulfitobacter pseudonitzschiae]|uniref:AAA family ATPase n=1 Tax=Pseudosulfitobacter pseudonitzschiae TaxID=1402135 RepID=A0A9Q2NJR6_9RHOB|nr:helicase RepA family protein [Pseudosulfitobacter pseudonitzschiae]MBM2293459.1 AAA family ATPase [Pseudosulfitobacter pseudonitzschiae]MBM2298273.1 AAA family ATPase [Pseudosulfitobacter pseudonitzschiae]MBM2303187.1 AAA family ATPase [Pseudosulfitobacter pseudonitzschiae]MBM2312970.1 AAA family ATPase [Pseudosulfitobacter pseudonitzschiae]MBM2317883.1 AAA family ATPase [Pseudosulfitobacter pseudonitzschiae]